MTDATPRWRTVRQGPRSTHPDHAPPAIAPRPIPPADVIAARRAACATCEHRQGDRCHLCGCAAPIEHRAASPWQTCPAGKWPG